MTLAAQALLRTISRVAGSEIVEDAIAFFRAFEGMEEGFRQRARRVEELLGEPGTAFVLVVAPREDSIDEARFFARRLAESSIPVSALVVNRLFPNFASARSPPAPAGETSADAGEPTAPPSPLEAAGAGAATRRRGELVRRGSARRTRSSGGISRSSRSSPMREERYVGELAEEVAPAPVVRVPFLREDVHDLEGLRGRRSPPARGPTSLRSWQLVLIVSDSESVLAELRSALEDDETEIPRASCRRGRAASRRGGPSRSRDHRSSGRQHGWHGDLPRPSPRGVGRPDSPRAGRDPARPPRGRVSGPTVGGRRLAGQTSRPDHGSGGPPERVLDGGTFHDESYKPLPLAADL